MAERSCLSSGDPPTHSTPPPVQFQLPWHFKHMALELTLEHHHLPSKSEPLTIELWNHRAGHSLHNSDCACIPLCHNSQKHSRYHYSVQDYFRFTSSRPSFVVLAPLTVHWPVMHSLQLWLNVNTELRSTLPKTYLFSGFH